MTGLRTDGHLSDLGLEWALAGEASDPARAHLETCALCQARRDAALEVVAPPRAPTASVPVAANRPWMWALLAAAVALLVTVPLVQQGTGDGIRVKGSGVGLQIFTDTEPSKRLKDGDSIGPGQRLGFKLRNREAGYVLVVANDADGNQAVCFPQHLEGEAAPVEASPRPRALHQAVRTDDSTGTETFTAVFCPEPFGLESLDALPEGCSEDVVTLVKR